MSTSIRSKLVKIGNSRGVRIPRSLLEQVGLTDEVEMMIEEGKLIILPASSSRRGWAAQFAAMAERGDDQLLEHGPETQWEEDEWEWS